jgi:hypothetical protein
MGNYDGRSIKTQIVKKSSIHSQFNLKKEACLIEDFDTTLESFVRRV